MNNRLLLLLFILLFPTSISLYFYGKQNREVIAPKQTLKNLDYKIPLQHWLTNEGTRVYFVPTEGLPIVDINVNFAAGSARDGDKPGLATLCAYLLDKGTPTQDADQIATQFENTGAQYHANVDKDRMIVSLRSLTTPDILDPIVQLFSDVITQPAFKEEQIEIEKNQILVAIRHDLQQPNTLAAHAFYQAIYQQHPYAHPNLGTEESVSPISKTDLIQFHQRYIVRQNATIVMVGGISEVKAKEIANIISNKLTNGQEAAALPEVPSLSKAIDLNIPFKSEQSHILMGQPCVSVNDPDYFPLLIGNYILGGNLLNSVLYKEIRETRGLAYNISSSLFQLQKPGPFIMRLQTKNDQTKEAIDILRNTLVHYIQDGPVENEILEAKEGLIRAFPLALSSNYKIADIISTVTFYNLPTDFLSTYQKRVENVPIQEIKSTLQRRIHPNQMALVVVGASLD